MDNLDFKLIELGRIIEAMKKAVRRMQKPMISPYQPNNRSIEETYKLD